MTILPSCLDVWALDIKMPEVTQYCRGLTLHQVSKVLAEPGVQTLARRAWLDSFLPRFPRVLDLIWILHGCDHVSCIISEFSSTPHHLGIPLLHTLLVVNGKGQALLLISGGVEY